jgi:hypothetical protein
MDAQPAIAAGQLLQRKRVVTLGGFRIVDAVILDFGQRQVRGYRRRRQLGKSRSPGKMLEQETPQMKLMQVRQRAAALEQASRRQLRRRTGFIQRLPFDAVFIRLV